MVLCVFFQLYHSRFLHEKKKLHGIYKFVRPANLVDLVKDLSKHAVNREMAYTPGVGDFNEAYVAKARRGLRLLAGTLDLDNKLK